MKKFTFLILLFMGTIVTLAQDAPRGRADLGDVMLNTEFPTSTDYSGVLAIGFPNRIQMFDLQSGKLYTAEPPQQAPDPFVDHNYGSAYPVWYPTNPDLVVTTYQKYVSIINLTEGRWQQISTGIPNNGGMVWRGRQADWSPDGKHIIYNDAYNRSQGDIIVYDVETTDMTRISISFDGADVQITYPVWHPKNDTIVFIGYEELELVNDPNPDTDPSGERIYTIPVGCWEDTNGCTAMSLLPGDLGTTLAYRFLDFNADGTRLLTIGQPLFGQSNVYLYEISTETLQQITDIDQDTRQFIHSPAFSPDGEAIAFVLRDYENSDHEETLIIQDLSGARPTYRLDKFGGWLYDVTGLSWREGTYTYIPPADL